MDNLNEELNKQIKPKKPRSEAQKRADKKYYKTKTVGFYMRFFRTDQDILDRFKEINEGKAEYVRRLIREDIARNKGK